MTERPTPPYRAEHVGSLLRPKALYDARLAISGSQDHPTTRVDAAVTAKLTALEDAAIRDVVAMQERIGLRSVTDGEYRRLGWHQDFMLSMTNVDLRYEVGPIAFRDAKGAKIAGPRYHFTGKVRLEKPFNVEAFKFLKSVTARTPKINIPSPTVSIYFSDRSSIDRTAYPERRMLEDDLIAAYRMEISALAAAGCRYIQLDDTSFAMICDPKWQEAFRAQGLDPKAEIDAYVRIVNAVINGRPKDMVIAVHLCRGNRQGKWMAEGGYDYVAEALFGALDVDAYFLEYDSSRAGSFAPLALVPKSKVVVLGLVTTKTPELETGDHLKRRIEEATRYIALDNLCLSPQCGFSSSVVGNPLTLEEQKRKLGLVAATAGAVWQ